MFCLCFIYLDVLLHRTQFYFDSKNKERIDVLLSIDLIAFLVSQKSHVRVFVHGFLQGRQKQHSGSRDVPSLFMFLSKRKEFLLNHLATTMANLSFPSALLSLITAVNN